MSNLDFRIPIYAHSFKVVELNLNIWNINKKKQKRKALVTIIGGEVVHLDQFRYIYDRLNIIMVKAINT